MFHIAIHKESSKKAGFVPTDHKLKVWAKAALCHKVRKGELSLSVVGKTLIHDLNKTYRHKDKPTNVLSFQADLPKAQQPAIPLLGDIIICAEIVNREAKEQDKSEEAHWAHMVVHGCLHILGYDHEKDREAAVMEAQEIRILKKLGFTNPYL